MVSAERLGLATAPCFGDPMWSEHQVHWDPGSVLIFGGTSRPVEERCEVPARQERGPGGAAVVVWQEVLCLR